MTEYKRSFRLGGPVPGIVRVIFTTNMVKTAKRFDYSEEEAKSLFAFCELENERRPIMVVTLNAKPDEIVHECGHVAFCLAKYAGIPVTYDDNEYYCYVLDYIFSRTLKLQEKLINGRS